MNDVTMYTSSNCPFCKQAEAFLLHKGIKNINKIYIDDDDSQRLLMINRTKRRTVPQIFIGTRYVGGFDNLAKLERDGELDSLLLTT